MPEFGDIYVWRFPFTSGTFSKPRPVLVLFDLEVDVLICRKSRLYFPERIRLKRASTLMRHLLLRSLATLACLGIFSLPQISAAMGPDQADKPNFSGTWTLDRQASNSLELVVVFSLKLNGEPDETSARQIWHKQP